MQSKGYLNGQRGVTVVPYLFIFQITAWKDPWRLYIHAQSATSGRDCPLYYAVEWTCDWTSATGTRQCFFLLLSSSEGGCLRSLGGNRALLDAKSLVDAGLRKVRMPQRNVKELGC